MKEMCPHKVLPNSLYLMTLVVDESLKSLAHSLIIAHTKAMPGTFRSSITMLTLPLGTDLSRARFNNP